MSRQWRLLDLQALDTRLDQIEHRKRHLPELARLAELGGRTDQLDTELVRARTAESDVQREVTKAEADVQLVRDRMARNQSRLDAGQGTAKDLQALQHEIGSLTRRQTELEDLELEVMERAEALQAEAAELGARREELAGQVSELESSRDAALRELDAERDKLVAERTDIAAGVGEDLLALYDKIRASSGGVGAAPLVQRRCGGCQLELGQVDLSRIRAAEEDEVLRCEECRRILVRTSESGL
ncbi:MAG TPA: C4-type zinc ribbon domain-containing protein [Segeticoccus sp.]|uniref:zinc ribbon domain-containing protein n=1 Tax=Segeticoccus sp. TaxID=2706531 RepID=UPI002D7EBD44|nr:C4-type zinc ribbon domain-containing protein [Segeticoccus sp.]HET8602265.1 C4-type zinc ribbon domain-containing protein [Segeticoccus sp.]